MRAAYAPSWTDITVVMRIARALIDEKYSGDTLCDAAKRALVQIVRKAMTLTERVHHNRIPEQTFGELAIAQMGRCRISLLVRGTQTLFEHKDIVAVKMCIHLNDASYCMGSAHVYLVDMSRGRTSGARVPLSTLIDSTDDFKADIGMVLPGIDRVTTTREARVAMDVDTVEHARVHMHHFVNVLTKAATPTADAADDDEEIWEAGVPRAAAPAAAQAPAAFADELSNIGIGDEDDDDSGDERYGRPRPPAYVLPPVAMDDDDDDDDEDECVRMCTTKAVTDAHIDELCVVASTEQRSNTLVNAQFTSVNKTGLTKYLGVTGAIFSVDDMGTPLVSFISRESSITLYPLDKAHLFYEAMGVVAYAFKNA